MQNNTQDMGLPNGPDAPYIPISDAWEITETELRERFEELEGKLSEIKTQIWGTVEEKIERKGIPQIKLSDRLKNLEKSLPFLEQIQDNMRAPLPSGITAGVFRELFFIHLDIFFLSNPYFEEGCGYWHYDASSIQKTLVEAREIVERFERLETLI